MRLNGRDHYLGKHGTKEADSAYNRLIATWLGNGRSLPSAGTAGASVAEIALAYIQFAAGYYRWMDVARDYAGKWHHTQQVFDAVNRPSTITNRRLGHP